MMSDTPRTDAAAFEILSRLQSGTELVVPAEDSKQLERELVEARRGYEIVLDQIRDGLRADLARVSAELDAANLIATAIEVERDELMGYARTAQKTMQSLVAELEDARKAGLDRELLLARVTAELDIARHRITAQEKTMPCV